MSGREELIVEILPDGTVRVEVVGVEGPSCEELARPFYEALGGAAEVRRKPDYYRQPVRRTLRQGRSG